MNRNKGTCALIHHFVRKTGKLRKLFAPHMTVYSISGKLYICIHSAILLSGSVFYCVFILIIDPEYCKAIAYTESSLMRKNFARDFVGIEDAAHYHKRSVAAFLALVKQIITETGQLGQSTPVQDIHKLTVIFRPLRPIPVWTVFFLTMGKISAGDHYYLFICLFCDAVYNSSQAFVDIQGET